MSDKTHTERKKLADLLRIKQTQEKIKTSQRQIKESKKSLKKKP